MKRLWVILGFLLLGAIVNVAVAWGCVCWSEIHPDSDMVKDTPWPAPVPDGWPETANLWTRRGLGISYLSAKEAMPGQSDDDGVWDQEPSRPRRHFGA